MNDNNAELIDKLENDIEIKRDARILLAARFLTFLSFMPYLSSDLSKFEKKEISEMMALKNVYIFRYSHYTSFSNDYLAFSKEFIVYLDIVEGWDETAFWFEKFLTEFCTIEVDENHINRCRSALIKIAALGIKFIDVAKCDENEAAKLAILTYLKEFQYKKKNKKKMIFKWYHKTAILFFSLYFVLLILQY